jgi:hypothetical protein
MGYDMLLRVLLTAVLMVSITCLAANFIFWVKYLSWNGGAYSAVFESHPWLIAGTAAATLPISYEFAGVIAYLTGLAADHKPLFESKFMVHLSVLPFVFMTIQLAKAI